MQAGQAADAVRQKPQREQQAHHPFPGVRIDEQHHARHHAQCARDQGNDRAEACEALHTDVEQDIRDAHRHSDDAVHDDKSRQRTIRLRKGVAAKPQQQDSLNAFHPSESRTSSHCALISCPRMRINSSPVIVSFS